MKDKKIGYFSTSEGVVINISNVSLEESTASYMLETNGSTHDISPDFSFKNKHYFRISHAGYSRLNPIKFEEYSKTTLCNYVDKMSEANKNLDEGILTLTSSQVNAKRGVQSLLNLEPNGFTNLFTKSNEV